jgi:hypothetical protein
MSNSIRATILSLGVLMSAACTTPVDAGAGSPPEEPAEDACGASKWQGLVGKHRSEIPQAPAGAVWRVHSTDSMVTMDYSAERMNIRWDPQTERVVDVRCG